MVKISILMTSLCEVRGTTGPGANKSKQEINCIGSEESGRGAAAESIIAFESPLFFFFVPALLTIGTCFLSTEQMRICPMSWRHVLRSMHQTFTFHLQLIFFFWRGGVKRARAVERIQNSASVITKESLFGTLPPQMARRLMFLSRCVAFSLPSMGCVHSHCLRSKIEGESCKLWMPPRQRHNTAKTICVDISVAPVRLCVLLLEASERRHAKQTNNAGELV